MGLHHGPADGRDYGLAIETLQSDSPQLSRDREALYTRFAERERGARAGLQRRMTDFDRALDVLGIMIAATGDDDILDTAGHVEFATVQEAQVAGTQERSVAVGEPCMIHLVRLCLFVPIAGGDVRTAQPNFAHHAVRQDRPRRWLHDTQILSRG